MVVNGSVGIWSFSCYFDRGGGRHFVLLVFWNLHWYFETIVFFNWYFETIVFFNWYFEKALLVFWYPSLVLWMCQLVFWYPSLVLWMCQLVFWLRLLVFWFIGILNIGILNVGILNPFRVELIFSVKINPSLVMMRECKIMSKLRTLM